MRIKSIDRVWNTLSHPSLCEYLWEVQLVADISPIALRFPYSADCITLRGTLRKAQWNKSPRYPFDFIRAYFPSVRIHSASWNFQSRSKRISLFRELRSTLHHLHPYCGDSTTDFWLLDMREKAMKKKSFFIAPMRLSLVQRPTLLNFNARMWNLSKSSVHLGGFPVCP